MEWERMGRATQKEVIMGYEPAFDKQGQVTGPSMSNRSPAASRGEMTLAMSPFLLVLLFDALPKLLVESGLSIWESAGMRILNAGLGVLSIACVLGVFILAWRRKWPTWSATWYFIFCIPLVLLIEGFTSLLMQGQFDLTISQEIVMLVWIPLIVAVLLYAVTRLDPRRGMLAALPVMYLLWQTNMEFVPDSIEIAIKVPSIALISLTIAFILRRQDWRAGLFAVLAMNLVVGALFAYAGIYYGGTLPFSAPGPNPVEVARSLIPQYLATCAILLGPLFAWRFRRLGHAGGRARVIAYHVALAGLLLVILANLSGLMLTLQVDANTAASAAGPAAPALLLGVGAYLAGVLWLNLSRPLSRSASGWAEHTLLVLLPLAIPMAFMLTFITWKWPVSSLYGIPLLWVLPHGVSLSLGLVWLGLSVWVITREGESSGQPTAFQGASEVFSFK